MSRSAQEMRSLVISVGYAFLALVFLGLLTCGTSDTPSDGTDYLEDYGPYSGASAARRSVRA